MKDFQGPKANFKYFQGLEIGLQKFKGFQEFQDTYEPCRMPIITSTCIHKYFVTPDLECY